jgi:two-component SAPR family response regulator
MGLTKGEIGLLLWPESSTSELKLRFKNAIYRMRHAIGSDVVLFQDNIYLFNRAVDHEYDVENFVSAIKKASEEKQNAKKIEALNRAISLYQGHYLPTLDAEWVITDRERYQTMFSSAAEEQALLLLEQRSLEEAFAIAQKALDLTPYHEPLHRIIMRIYAARGDRPSILRQYEKCQNLLLNEIGAPPSEQTEQLYHQLFDHQ